MNAVRSAFDTFADPLVYTPGDNEWSDCHRVNNGSYNPLERLDAIQQEIVDQIAERTATFAGEVLVVQGDSHTYVADTPLGLDNFNRVVVHGAALPFEYLRLTIDPRDPELFSWERVPVTP